MSTIDPASGFARYDLQDPQDLAQLVQMPMFWRTASPEAAQQAMEAIASGDAPLTAAVPAAVIPAINDMRNRMGKPPLGDAETPAEEAAPTEEPDVAPAG